MPDPDQHHPRDGAAPRLSSAQRAQVSAGLTLALAELLRAGVRTPTALVAIAERHRKNRTPLAVPFERIASGIRDEGQSLFEAVHGQRTFFTSRFVACLALANLGGVLFRVFVERLRAYVREFEALAPEAATDFPLMRGEVSEFCFFLGHLIVERASQPEVQRWLPRVFSPQLRLPATHVLGRFYDQGLLLSDAFARTPPFDDPEMVLAVLAGEELNRVGYELLSLSTWLTERARLEERTRFADWIIGSAHNGTAPEPKAKPPDDHA